MSQRDDNNLTLVLEIQKYEYLYNFKMSEYTRKDLTDKAWGEISKKIGITAAECKEKWRNIRSAFVRSLKWTGGRSKRPYYLAEELNFILPYTKPHQNTTTHSNNIEQIETDHFTDLDLDNAESNMETKDMPLYVTADNHSTKAGLSPVTEAQTYANDGCFESSPRRRRKRPKSEVEQSFMDYLSYKMRKSSFEGSQPTHSPIEYFFLSLMPDIESMTQEQVRRFKIEVMLLIDKIKNNEQEQKYVINSVEQFQIT